MRESEKYKLDCKLHQQIMTSIVTLQRWFRSYLERRRFLKTRSAVVVIQSYCRLVNTKKYMENSKQRFDFDSTLQVVYCTEVCKKVSGYFENPKILERL